MRVSSPGLRLALVIGFGGMLLISLIAGVDALRLLGQMRIENKILRDAALDRSRRLSSIRSYVLLSDAYAGDYLFDADQDRSGDHLTQLRDTWSHMLGDLSGYQMTTVEETVLLKRLRELLDQHWQDVSRAMAASEQRQRTESAFYGDQILPLRTAVLEITTRVEDVNAKQQAAAEAEIQHEFENMGRQLSVVLEVALATAILLAAGCILYILRIEKQNKRRYEQILEARGELERLSARLVAAQEEERRTISRELHDEVGQTLSAVLVDAANLANRIPSEDTVARQYLESIRSHADSSVNSIRNIALLLRPSMLDDLGLIPALEWQAREVSRREGIKVRVTDENVPDTLPDAVRTCIYRLVQEALHNVAAHSGAKNVMVNVRRENSSLILLVEDDGAGFDSSRTRGMGLLGMEERVKQLGGRMDIQSEPGKGTRVRASLPIE
jgi:signal transduction histidine kinase